MGALSTVLMKSAQVAGIDLPPLECSADVECVFIMRLIMPPTNGAPKIYSGYWSGRVLRARAIDLKVATRGSSLRK